jgi:hypothetical protein
MELESLTNLPFLLTTIFETVHRSVRAESKRPPDRTSLRTLKHK